MPRQTDGNVSVMDDAEEIKEEDELDITGNIINQNQVSEQNVGIDDNFFTPQMSSPSISLTATQKRKKPKKSESGDNFKKQLIALETKKPAALTESPVLTDDEDMYFFRSILPYFKKMSPIQKLRVRNDIQTILIRESLPSQQFFDSPNAHNQNHSFPSVFTIRGSAYSSVPSASTANLQYSEDTYSGI